MAKSKIAYISYVEDTKKHHNLIAKSAAKATKKAVKRSRKADIPITYLDGLQIIKELPEGKRIVIGTVQSRREVKVGSTEKVSQG
ncbi:MAG: hypothetical protein M3R25_13160 [Bacteroidota bacterium]|nr:hypothetical protein [Bacteroidota bacterium]